MARGRGTRRLKSATVRTFVQDDATAAPAPGQDAVVSAAPIESGTAAFDARLERWRIQREKFERLQRARAAEPATPSTKPESPSSP